MGDNTVIWYVLDVSDYYETFVGVFSSYEKAKLYCDKCGYPNYEVREAFVDEMYDSNLDEILNTKRFFNVSLCRDLKAPFVNEIRYSSYSGDSANMIFPDNYSRFLSDSKSFIIVVTEALNEDDAILKAKIVAKTFIESGKWPEDSQIDYDKLLIEHPRLARYPSLGKDDKLFAEALQRYNDKIRNKNG